MPVVEFLGKYEIRRQIGRGGTGIVYEGFDPDIERTVAIKTIRLTAGEGDEAAEEIARFRREARAAGRLTHPNIVGVFDYGETGDLAYIVMEYVDGPALKTLLDKKEIFPLPAIVRIMEDLLAGLQFSHDRGVVHRDIKPANLMLAGTGQTKIADFGIARIEDSGITRTGTILGTPAYMAPEQFLGQAVDARADIYAAGVVLYQLLTGARPYEGDMSAIMHKALYTEPPPPSRIAAASPRGFDAVVRRAMAKAPEDRYASAAAFAAAIRAAAAAPAQGDGDGDGDGGEDIDDSITVVTNAGAAGPSPAAMPRSAVSPAPVGPPVDPVSDPVSEPAEGEPAAAEPTAVRKMAPRPVAAVLAVLGSLAIAGGFGYVLLAGGAWLPGALPPVVPPVAAPSPVPPADGGPPSPASVPAASTPVAPFPVAPVPAAPIPISPIPAAPVPAASVPAAPIPAAPVIAARIPATPIGPESAPIPATAATEPPAQPSLPPPPEATSPPAPVTAPQTAIPAAPVPQIAMAPPPVAPNPLEGVRSELAAFVAQLPCAIVDGAIRDGAVQMNGLAGATAIDAIRRKLTAMGLTRPVPWLRIEPLDSAFCPLADLLRPAAPAFGDPGARLSLRLDGDPSWLRKDDYIRPRLTMAGFRGELRVDYLDRQGNVQHLYPQLGDPGERLAADPPRLFAPGEPVALGDPGPNNRGWQVDEPFGTDMIVAVASEDALFERPRPANVEKAAVYLRDLKTALDRARERGTKLTAAVLPVETRRK